MSQNPTINRALMLVAVYGSPDIRLDQCADLFGMSSAEASRRAKVQGLPVPVFRAGTQKSPWLVSATALASYLDRQEMAANDAWQKMRDAA